MSVLKNTKSLEEFVIVLREYEIKTFSKFVCIKSDKAFSEVEFIPNENMKLLWNGDVPHFYIGRRVYACHQGKDTNLSQKKRYAEKRDYEACKGHNFTERRKLAQPTKKLDCPVKINVSRMLALPSFKVNKLTRWEKVKMAEVIKDKVKKGEDILGENLYSFNLPDQTSHENHVVGLAAAVTETVDSKVRSKIKELVSEGKRNISIITELLEQYVVNELGETDKLRSRFYPQRDCVRNIVNTVKREMRWSKIDLENAEKLAKSWEEKSDLSGIFFRPWTVQEISREEFAFQEDDECEDEHQTLKWKQTPRNHLLFVYQSKQMEDLYHRYGKDSILLDAAHKTCKWALPLYFLAVKTNVGYQPVAVFITQYETQQAIFEALNVIKEWNPQVNPKFAMVDFAMEEILAIEATFPGTEVFICTFHREQAWRRWVSKETVRSCVPRAEALKKLRAIADAPNEEQLQEAVAEMKKWRYYDESPLKTYFERLWLPEIRRWALAYKPPGLLLHTNNRVERINEDLKYRYLLENKNCSLSEMMNIVVTHFLPDRYRSYVAQNIPHKSTDEDVSNDLFCPAQEYGKLGLRKSKKNKLISECNFTIRSLQSAMWLMEEEHLEKLKSELQLFYKKATLNVTVDKDTALPTATPSTEAKALYQYAELPNPVKKKVKRFGKSADAKENCMDLLNSIIDEANIKNTSVSIEEFSPTLEVATSISISPEKNKFKPYGSKIPASLIEDLCKPGIKLDDRVINYAQKIIYSQEKQKAGFQDTILGQCLKFKKQRSGIQILHNGVDHWVTIRIVDHCNIELYDSMGLPLTKSLQNQISMIVQNTESGTILIHRKAVQIQEINDCGVLAIAFALSLARKKNPEDLTYCARSLRGHLRACLMSGVFTDFKETNDIVDRVKASTFTVTI